MASEYRTAMQYNPNASMEEQQQQQKKETDVMRTDNDGILFTAGKDTGRGGDNKYDPLRDDGGPDENVDLIMKKRTH